MSLDRLEREVHQDIQDNLATIKQLENLSRPIALAANRIASSIRAGKKVVFLGNGGSAADAQHMAGELVGRYLGNHKPYAAIALTTNSSVLTAISNDFSFAEVFSRQLIALGKRGDVVVAISTSGNSENVIRAVKTAGRIGAVTVGLTGRGGGALRRFVDIPIVVPSKNTQRIQEAHSLIGHVICKIVELELEGRS